MSTDINSFVLSAEQQLHLARISASTGKSPAELLEQFLRQYPAPVSDAGGLNGTRTLYDAFAEDGSIGMIKDGPTDVSTNPKYMEGFGRSGN